MADIDFDVDALEDMAYRDIQALCKRIGIRANQKVRSHHKLNVSIFPCRLC
jgi:hypothetical protein